MNGDVFQSILNSSNSDIVKIIAVIALAIIVIFYFTVKLINRKKKVEDSNKSKVSAKDNSIAVGRDMNNNDIRK